MATGDQDDFKARINALIPNGWFAVGSVPLRDAVVAGGAALLSFAYAVLGYARQQTRIGTATDGFLDMIAADFFGDQLPRRANQSDASYRARITSGLFRERGTRNAVVQVVTQLTGRAPVIFEPMRPADTGGYGAGAGYGVAGGYGSMLLPTQSFVTAFRPLGAGIPNVAGYGVSSGGYAQASQADYASFNEIVTNVTDEDILAAINSVRPSGYTIWARVSN